jgi:hypothetical protein
VKTILVTGEKTFRIQVPDDARMTFGPFSPPAKGGGYQPDKLAGTLRIYKGAGTTNILAVFSNVTSFRDISIEYEEQVAREEGAVLWKSDKDGYKREEKVKRSVDWVPELPAGNAK